ncbi:MAG: hypothetical protein FJY98_03090 [Candidatus Liptonbacteria bacterium]|nr:hypothetical protein [Candidatus Liptonbacteria bacterium]
MSSGTSYKGGNVNLFSRRVVFVIYLCLLVAIGIILTLIVQKLVETQEQLTRDNVNLGEQVTRLLGEVQTLKAEKRTR